MAGGCARCGQDMGNESHLSLTTPGGPVCGACCVHCRAQDGQEGVRAGKVMVTHQNGEEGGAA